jgi:hypothetical protein
MADGRINCGGLVDRFRGMVSLYKIAQENNILFKINFTSPDELTNYLLPNEYDWTIDTSEIKYDVKESAVCVFWSGITENNAATMIQQLLKRYNQLHITTNMNNLREFEFGIQFNQLFKPTSELKELIDYNLSMLGGNFISVTFRFQALLGDFYEGSYPVLSDDERISLINRCVNHLADIRLENTGENILVTSDSITFLNKVKDMDFVYIVPGKIAHIDYSLGLEKKIYIKSFLDYFLLTHSKKIYLVIDGQMYNSGFAYQASFHKSRYIVKRY